jgi:hypothetical protein
MTSCSLGAQPLKEQKRPVRERALSLPGRPAFAAGDAFTPPVQRPTFVTGPIAALQRAGCGVDDPAQGMVGCAGAPRKNERGHRESDAPWQMEFCAT